MALIITIIILIILAAISINVIIDSRMIDTTVSGTDNYVEAGEVENRIMQNAADYLGDIVSSMTGESGTGGSSGDDSGSGFTDEEIAELIGKYVAYTPDEKTYAVVTNSSTYTGTTSNDTDFTTDISLNWQIWSITDDTLTLIADTTAQSGGGYYDSSSYGWCLYLYKDLGYNNGVKILNDICKTCYSSSSVNGTGVVATARSFNIQDIEEVLDWRIWAPSSYSTSYGQTYTSGYKITASRYYPGLWPQEDYSNIDGTEVKASYTYDNSTGKLTYTGNGLRRSEQTRFCTESVGQASSYIYPTATFWNINYGYVKEALASDEYWSLICDSRYFWLASRAIYISSWQYVNYGLQYYGNGTRRDGILDELVQLLYAVGGLCRYSPSS